MTEMDYSAEEWRPVVGYEDFYEVSDLGRLRGLLKTRQRRGRVSRAKRTTGYQRRALCAHGTRKTMLLHRIVAAAFLGPCPDGCEVNHKDGDKSNNRASNLEYVTHQKNAQHAARLGLMPIGERHGLRIRPERSAKGERLAGAKMTDEKVRDLRERAAAGVPTKALMALYGVSRATVEGIKNGRKWKHVI